MTTLENGMWPFSARDGIYFVNLTPKHSYHVHEERNHGSWVKMRSRICQGTEVEGCDGNGAGEKGNRAHQETRGSGEWEVKNTIPGGGERYNHSNLRFQVLSACSIVSWT